jgi:hypothetical protein
LTAAAAKNDLCSASAILMATVSAASLIASSYAKVLGDTGGSISSFGAGGFVSSAGFVPIEVSFIL